MKACIIQEPLKMYFSDKVDIPVPAPDEILLKVMAAGVCGTDIHIYKGDYYGSYPRIPGHEFAGIVETVGHKVTRFAPGQRVAADPNIFCESCGPCKRNEQNFCEQMTAVGVERDGAFAQYLTVPERCVFDIGDLSFTAGSMVEPLACVVHGHNIARMPLGANVLIFGAGPIGLMHTQLSAMNGAAFVTVVDLLPDKLAMAKKMGAQYTYTSQEFTQAGKPNSYDLVIDCTGVPAVVESAVQYVRDTGTLLFFGVAPTDSHITINPYEVYKRELHLVGSFALKKTFGAALELAKSGKLNLLPLVSDRLELEGVPAFFEQLVHGNTGFKAVIYPNGIPQGEIEA